MVKCVLIQAKYSITMNQVRCEGIIHKQLNKNANCTRATLTNSRHLFKDEFTTKTVIRAAIFIVGYSLCLKSISYWFLLILLSISDNKKVSTPKMPSNQNALGWKSLHFSVLMELITRYRFFFHKATSLYSYINKIKKDSSIQPFLSILIT